MELLAVDYGDFPDTVGGEQLASERSACLRVLLSVDPVLLERALALEDVVSGLCHISPTVENVIGQRAEHDERTAACLIGSIILDLQRDLCDCPAMQYIRCQATSCAHIYEVCVESVDERVGQFSAQLAVQIVRLMLLQERFDPRLVWLVDLVRHLCREPRFPTNARRVALELNCSRSSAEWAVQELERYGYICVAKSRHSQQPKKGHMLVVDDSAQIRDVLTRILELQGYGVITAVDGEEGLVLLNWTEYKAIFFDLMMPCLDGTTLLQRARAQGIEQPIFVVSAYEHRWKADEIRKMGATAYLTKPFSATEIDSLIKQYVQ